MLRRLARWYQGYFVRGDGARLEPAPPGVRLRRPGRAPSGRTLLAAEEYTTGRLDWPDVDATIGDLGPTPAGRVGTLTRQVRLPTPAGFPGMPADRLWQFEDARVYLGGLEAGPTDLARMALVEFSLAYGVDWFVLPVELVAGSVYWVHQLDVVDTFGSSVTVGSARGGGWSMFGLGQPGEQTFVADVLASRRSCRTCSRATPSRRSRCSATRWRTSCGASSGSCRRRGRPVNRTRLVAKVSLRQQLPGDLGDAAIVYRLMTPVPDHWVPFVAVPAPAGGVELERRPLLHFRDDGTTDVTHPLGVLLNEGGTTGCGSPRRRCRATAPSSPAATSSPAPPTAARRCGSAAANGSARAKAGAASASTLPCLRARPE